MESNLVNLWASEAMVNLSWLGTILDPPCLGKGFDNCKYIVCIAFDAISLYPSLNGRETGKVVNKQLQECDIKFEDVNYLEISRYIASTSTVWEAQRMGVMKLLPTRRKNTGSKNGGHK